jgi:hypothetical protein
MGGLVIDIYVAFIVKSLIRAFWLIRSSRWPRMQATVVRAIRESDWCPILTLSYDFVGTSGSDGDSTEIPFLFSQTADQCAKQFLPGRRVTIRADSEGQRRTILSLHDEQ